MVAGSIVDRLNPGPEQAQAIATRRRDIVVTAGAGTGKTRTLVGRYLSLLEEGLGLSHIVAITFTLRAAREMRNRVREEVRLHLEDRGDDPFWADIYEGLNAAHIGTIHSLCAEILRRHPVEAGLDPGFRLLDDAEMALEREQAVTTALGWAAEDPAAAALFDWYDEARLRALLSGALAKSLDMRPVLEKLPGDLWAAWKPVLLAPFIAFVADENVRGAMEVLQRAEQDGTLARAFAVADKFADGVQQALVSWREAQRALDASDLEQVLVHLSAWRGSLKGGRGTAKVWGNPGAREEARILRELFDERLEELVKAGDPSLDRVLAQEVVPAFARLFNKGLLVYEKAKDQAIALDYDDLESRALSLLRGHPAVLAEWRSEVQAILVDEFQDTNARQRDLVQLLNGGRGCLFIVGDAKQSIYGFRGADVTVFREEHRRVAREGLALELSTTYRAHDGLVAAHNVLLQPILGRVADETRPYVEPYAPVISGRAAPARGVKPPHVELILAAGSRQGDAPAVAARALVARLTQLVSCGITLERNDPETGERQTGPLNYGDIAILCRASTSFGPYEDALEAAGIPYLTISGRGFYGRPEVRDLLNALQALADPTDDLALVGLLRSPAVAVDDMTIFNLRQEQRRLALPSLWALLQALDPAPAAGPGASVLGLDPQGIIALSESATGLDRCRSLVNGLAPLIGRRPAADVLKAFVDASNYRAILLSRNQERAVRNVDKLLVDALGQGQRGSLRSVGELVDYVRALRDVSSREGEGRGLASGAVQLMSIHQAKGLEFPIVVLGDICKRVNARYDALVDPDLGLVLPPPSSGIADAASQDDEQGESTVSMAYRLARRSQREREEAEADRLLYVAATRAQELLLVSGAVGHSTKGILQASGMLARLNSALHLENHLPPISAEGTQIYTNEWDLIDEITGEAVPVRCTLFEPGAEPELPSKVEKGPGLAAPVREPDQRMLEPMMGHDVYRDIPLQQIDRDPPPRVWRVVPTTIRPHAPAWVVGQVVHRALFRWSFPNSDPDFEGWALAEIQSYGVTDAGEQRDTLRRARRLLTRFQGSPLYREMAAAAVRLGEVPYSVVGEDGRLDSGIIDALCRGDSGWLLVEFKTDHVRSPEQLEELLNKKDYVPQVARYLRACRQLLPHDADGSAPAIRPILCFLDHERGVYLVEDRWR